jgi:predicted MFS family arabinose efflux permease
MRTSRRIVSGQLALVFSILTGTLTSFFLLLSVTSMHADAAGSGTAGAGLVTGALLFGTVIAELGATRLMTRFGYRPVLAAGLVLLGAPTLLMLAAVPVPVIAAVSFVRGFGFGLSGVVTGALVALLLPPERRGEGIGLSGVVEAVPAIVALPSGVWLADHLGYRTVVIMAAVAALAPLAAFLRMHGVAKPAADADETAGQPAGLMGALRGAGPRRLVLVFAASAAGAGVVAAFLPLAHGISAGVASAGLLAQAVAAAAGGWLAGRYGDRHGHVRLLTPGLVLSSAGLLAMFWLSAPVVVIAAMIVFGTGFGIIQNAVFAELIEQMPSRMDTASALWSLAYDTGYGAGPALFGLFAASTGYPVGFALTGALVLAAWPAARRMLKAAPVQAGIVQAGTVQAGTVQAAPVEAGLVEAALVPAVACQS